jgi:SNF2 family DNA or RNA helicase
VPTSVILNWETELKRFCPSFKVLCYYGSAKRRKELRTGWTKANVYHVVITSYQLAVQDAFAFKRKRWYYLVLDEAQNIKNFQSQRWQTLISFNTQRRLLLSGTPLQNTLLELWSLLHFLMPYIFRSRKEFSYWFANPMTSMIEGTSDHNSDVIQRLHGILRPFILRRLKKDVETQMPGKFEHVLKCQLSRRQMYLYEEFMARSSTRKALKSGSGNFMTMMNVLMQLRKVCNHPDLFEPRSVITPFVLDAVPIEVPSSILLVPKGVMERASTTILLPLWCGSSGLPSIESALFHDQIESDELMLLREELPEPSQMEFESLETTIEDDSALHDLLRRVREGRERNRRGNVRFLDKTNYMRCEVASFPYPLKLQHAVKVPGSFRDRTDLDTLNTPADLLALRRTQQQCANDLDELVKKFVFCIPKAGVRESPSIVGRDSSAPHEALLSPVEEYLHPFRSVQARLSSFFPDKKLIQFDSGKLQMLAELLRELKRGGHKTLIFTQMSKMLDILEAFLNLNGHTYLRLDGSTGVERRQRLMDRFNSDPKVFCFILSTRSGGLGINLTGADTVVFYDTDWYDPRI